MKKLGFAQCARLESYLDCKNKTKKKIFDREGTDYTPDELLIRNMLADSSMTEMNGDRAYHVVSDMVDLICHKMCPGLWCTRGHCQNYRGTCAYNCISTRPQVCNIYKKYLSKRIIDNSTYNFKLNERFIVEWGGKYTIVEVRKLYGYNESNENNDNFMTISLFKYKEYKVSEIRNIGNKIYRL